MFQRLKVLKDVLSLYLNRQTGLALLERVQASDLSDADRDRVSRIMRCPPQKLKVTYISVR